MPTPPPAAVDAVIESLPPATQPATQPADAVAATQPATLPAEPPEPRILHERDDRVVAVLPNRMILVAQRLPAAPVVSCQLFVKTGSLYEQEHVGAGLSHFLEHLLSGGTTSTRSEAESNAILGSIGAQINAATSLDNVWYYINTSSEHTETAIDLLSDWLRNNTIEQAEFDRERQVIQSEFSMGQGDPGRIKWKLTQQARYHASPDHPGSHPTIGYLDEFLTVTRDDVADFYQRMYVPNNMVFVVAGDIDPRKTIDMMAARWLDAEPRDLPEVRMPAEPETLSSVSVEGVAGIQRARVRYLWPGVVLGSEHDYALDLLSVVLGQGESSRLVRTLRDERQLVTSITAYNYSASWGRGFYGFDFEPAEGVRAESVIEAIDAELAKVRAELVSDAELARAKRQVIGSVVSSGQTAQDIAGRVARDIIASADPDERTRYIAGIEATTAEALRDAAGAVLPVGGGSRITLRPAGADEKITEFARPDTPDPDESGWQPFVLDNSRLIGELESSLASADASRVITLEAPETRTLSNGLTVIVRRSTVVPAVSMQLYTLGGLLAEEPGQEGVLNAAFSMLTRGAGDRNATQLVEAVEDLGATIDAASGANTAYVSALALASDWPAVMELMADVTLRPRFEEGEWAKVQPRILASIARTRDQWNMELVSAFRERWFGAHPWSQLPIGRAEVAGSLTVEQLREAYFAHQQASRSALAVVGDVEPERVFAEAERLFGAMPEGDAKVSPPVPAPPPSKRVDFVQTNKPVTAVNLGFGPGISREHPDYAALLVWSSLISDFPGGYLQQALRGEGPGLSYVASGDNITGRVPGYFSVLFNTKPDLAPEATLRALRVVERALKEPPTDADLARAKAKVITGEFFGRQANGSLAVDLALDRLYGLDDPTGERLLDQVRSLSALDVRDAAVRHFSNPPLIVVLKSEPINEWGITSLLLTDTRTGD